MSVNQQYDLYPEAGVDVATVSSDTQDLGVQGTCCVLPLVVGWHAGPQGLGKKGVIQTHSCGWSSWDKKWKCSVYMTQGWALWLRKFLRVTVLSDCRLPRPVGTYQSSQAGSYGNKKRMRKARKKGKKREEKINSQEPQAKAEPLAETKRHLRLHTQRNEDQKNGELENSEPRRYLETSWVLVVNVFILTIANSLGLGHIRPMFSALGNADKLSNDGNDYHLYYLFLKWRHILLMSFD